MPDNATVSAMQLTEEQAKVVVSLERTGAALSLTGVLLIAFTFALFKHMRTVPNTFILFASIANIGASVASLIGLAGIDAGSDSSLCRAQAFLLEMFMQSDPWWSFAMAFNVFLVFFHAANPASFRRHLWLYCVICFGMPMIPAIVCLFVKSAAKGAVYGDATLWCWIDDEWNILRIFSYYLPIWICIFLSAIIYIAVGYQVFHQRNQLRNLTLSNPVKDLTSEAGEGDRQFTVTSPNIYATVVTEVRITSDICEAVHASPTTPRGSSDQYPWADASPAFDKSGGTARDADSLRHMPVPLPAIHGASGGGNISGYPASSTTVMAMPAQPSRSPPPPSSSVKPGLFHQHHASSSDPDSASSSGSAKPVITMPPARDNTTPRVTRTTVAPAFDSPRLTSSPRRTLRARTRLTWRRVSSKLEHMDPVKLAYLRTSFVFAISVLVTWTPSSINRVYALIYPTRISYGLNLASAAVLPLQGVWNAVIYFTTSWLLLRREVQRLVYRSRWLRRLGISKWPDGSGLADRGLGGSPAARWEGRHVRHVRHGRRIACHCPSPATCCHIEPAIGNGHNLNMHCGGIDCVWDGCHSDIDADDLNDGVSLGLGYCSCKGSGSLRGAQQLHISDLEMSPRRPPRMTTLRVQRGGQLDI